MRYKLCIIAAVVMAYSFTAQAQYPESYSDQYDPGFSSYADEYEHDAEFRDEERFNIGLSHQDRLAIRQHLNNGNMISNEDDLRDVPGLTNEGYDQMVDDTNLFNSDEYYE